MANRNKNTKWPYDPDPNMLRSLPAPETPKHWGKTDAKYCKKLKGPHYFDIDENGATWREDGISISQSIRCDGSAGLRYDFWSQGLVEKERLPKGCRVESVHVSIYYRCYACGKKEYLSYKIDL